MPPSPPRTTVPAGNRWADRYGYARAIRIGDGPGAAIVITGAAPIGADGGCHAPGDGFAQALRCFEIIEAALVALGLAPGATHDGARASIVRSRCFVTDIARADEFGRAHASFFAGVTAPGPSGDRVPHRPCFTMVGIGALVDPAMLVEIECDAVWPG